MILWNCKIVKLIFTISAYSIFSIYFVKHNVHLIRKKEYSNINHVREDSFLTKGEKGNLLKNIFVNVNSNTNKF
jgi:phage anti-repressor protein